jgi:shikimate dehydrogenase
MLLGHPVSHSLSPAMQNAAFEALGRMERYMAVDVMPDRLRTAVDSLRSGLYAGANVTVPHKTAVTAFLDELAGEAALTQAVNTIVVQKDRLLGYNTDVYGAAQGLLQPVRERLRDATVLVLGAGGGARALLLAFSLDADRKPVEVVIAARHRDAAQAVAELGERVGLSCRAASFDSRGDELQRAGVVANCTPLGLADEDPLETLPLAGKVILDLAYHPGGTSLFRRAWREGALCLQGDEMLLHQGAESFRLWTGQEPPLGVMRKALEQAMKA